MKNTEVLKQLRQKSIKDLNLDLEKAYRKLREAKFSQTFRKLKDVREIKKDEKAIARIWTILTEKIRDAERIKNGKEN